MHMQNKSTFSACNEVHIFLLKRYWFFFLFLRTRFAKILDISAQASITKHSSPPKSLPPAKTFLAGRLRVKFLHNDEKWE